jgi:uncharacterized protein YpmB
MALTIIIILTFVFPTIVIVLMVLLYRHFKKKVAEERTENQQLIRAFQKLDATKESVINKLKRFVP